MDLMGTLVRHVSETQFESLPHGLVSITKKSVIDTLGAMIAGSCVEGCKLLMDYVWDCGGYQQRTVAVFGDKVSPSLAAQANGAMARAREIDDVSDIRPVHPSASIIPTSLAIAERQGTISGKESITVVALGQDLAMRFSLAAKTSCVILGRYNLFRVLACTDLGGKLLGLTEDQLWNAMGIAHW